MGATNAKKLLGQDNLLLLLNTSLSSTYAPMIAESQRAGVPLLFAASVCPKEVYPPAQPTLFCTTAFASQFDSRATLAFIKEKSGTSVNLGLAAMSIPLSRGEIDYAEGLAGEMGMKAVDKEIVPPAAPDYTPFATKLQQASPDWVYSWAPWVTEVKTLEALRKLGWEGNYIGWGHIETEGELARLKDGKFYAIGANALFSDKLPVQQEIVATATAANSTYAANLMTEGWIAGMVVETALKQAGWPATPEKVLAAMSHLKVDTKGLRGGPLEWTADNHFRTRQYYRVYRWNPASNGIEVVKDWTAYEVH
jgi:ABC-type branched-subunit amino acid transport system substrate-binding protein